MRAEITHRIQFAGLEGADNITMDLPRQVREKYGLEEDEVPEVSLYEAVEQLDPVEVADIYVQNPYSEDQLFPLPIANATINPDIAIEYAKLARFAEGGAGVDDVLGGDQTAIEDGGMDFAVDEEHAERMTYAVHSDDYAAVPHSEFFRPMASAFAEADLSNIAGEFRVYDYGAQVHGEVLFLDPETQLDRDDYGRLFTGVSVGNSYDGTCAMYAMGYAMDGYCKNTMRNLTERKSRKHVGEPEAAMNWWEVILTRMGGLRDILGEIIQEATEVEIDFLNQPYEIEDWYELVGFPTYLARAAATTARNRSAAEGGTRTLLNFWTLHSGATSALTHDFRGSSEVGSLETYYQLARDILWNPHRMMEQVGREWERRQRQQNDDEQLTLAGKHGLAQIEQYQNTLEDRKAEFEEREEMISNLLVAENEE